MTRDRAMRLEIGQFVLFTVRCQYQGIYVGGVGTVFGEDDVRAELVTVETNPVRLFPLGTMLSIPFANLMPLPTPGQAHVVADWLQDRGDEYAGVADLLRREFPMREQP